MRQTLTQSLVLALFLILGITTGTLAGPPEHPARDSLVAFNDRFNALAAQHDIEGLVALYDADAYWIAPNALPAQGRDGVPRQTITFMSKNKGLLSHTIDDLFISDDGTQAVMMGKTSAFVAAKNVDFEGTYIYVLRRGDESHPWRVVLDMFNTHPSE